MKSQTWSAVLNHRISHTDFINFLPVQWQQDPATNLFFILKEQQRYLGYSKIPFTFISMHLCIWICASMSVCIGHNCMHREKTQRRSLLPIASGALWTWHPGSPGLLLSSLIPVNNRCHPNIFDGLSLQAMCKRARGQKSNTVFLVSIALGSTSWSLVRWAPKQPCFNFKNEENVTRHFY